MKARFLFACTLFMGFGVFGDTSVGISGNSFVENITVIEVGEMVTWDNNGGFHNVVSDDGQFTSGSPSTSLWSYSFTFTEPGVFPYFCEIHGAPGGQGMSGVIYVGDVKVAIQNFTFTPQIVNIVTGQTVVWENMEGTHNVKADDGTFVSGVPTSGLWAFISTFDEESQNPYHCHLHGGPGGSGMSATINVSCDSIAYQQLLFGWPENSVLDLVPEVCISP